MQTVNKEGELAIAVCPECNTYSVCDPAWLAIEGQTLRLHCDNCGEDTEHLILKFTSATEPVTP
jgi:transcription elongation factor Elf1